MEVEAAMPLKQDLPVVQVLAGVELAVYLEKPEQVVTEELATVKLSSTGDVNDND
ncbi:MAG: hypothetical protein ABC596_08275 [Candidatus Methanosuratincola petrocarbonis]